MPDVSDRTKEEMEAGAKQAKLNADNFAKAMAARALEENPPQAEEQKAADDAGMAEATAEAEAQAVAAGKGFPRAKEPYQPKKPKE